MSHKYESCRIRRKTFRYMVAEKLIGNKIRPRTVIMRLYIESVIGDALRDREVSLCVVCPSNRTFIFVENYVIWPHFGPFDPFLALFGPFWPFFGPFWLFSGWAAVQSCTSYVNFPVYLVKRIEGIMELKYHSPNYLFGIRLPLNKCPKTRSIIILWHIVRVQELNRTFPII